MRKPGSHRLVLSIRQCITNITSGSPGSLRFCLLFILLSLILPQANACATGVSAAAALADTTSSVGRAHQENDLLQFKSGGHILGFKPGQVYFVGMGHALIEEFVDARQVTPVALTPPRKANKNMVAPAAPLKQVSYNNLWKGISLRYDVSENGLAESTYIVSPQADPSDIGLTYNMPWQIEDNGSLRFSHPSGNGWFSQSAPIAWQNIDGERHMVEVAFVTRTDHNLGFTLGDYNPAHPVLIDPVYQWHTFYGSALKDEGSAIAVDASGNIYVAGYSGASWGSPKNAHSGGFDITILKLDANGNYLWHSFFGGNQTDFGNGIALDSGGNVYVTGESNRNWGVNPKHLFSGSTTYELTVIKLNSSGIYQWHTFYGSSDNDSGNGIAVDSNGDLVIGGSSDSTWQGDGTTDPLHGHTSEEDITVLKLDSDGGYLWHTFYGAASGGGSTDTGNGIAVDSSNNIYLAGNSENSWNVGSDTPLHAHSGSLWDIVVLKLAGNGAYQWHTFYGTTAGFNEVNYGKSITLDSGNNVLVTGNCDGSWQGDNATAPLHAHSGDQDITVLKLDQDGGYLWHTFWGASTNDIGASITVDSTNTMYIAGYSEDSWLGDGSEAPLNGYTGGDDITLLALNSDGDYKFHSFYGSALDEDGYGIALGREGALLITGYGTGDWTSSALNPHTSGEDIVVLKIGEEFPWNMFLPAIIQGAN